MVGPVMLFAIAGLGIDFLLMAVAPSLVWLLVARTIGDATAANFSVASAYIADVTAPDKRSKALGLIGAAFGVGFIIGPVVGGLLAGIDLRLPFYVAAALVLVNVAYGFFVLPESLPLDRRAPFVMAKATPFSALKGLVQLRGVGGCCGSTPSRHSPSSSCIDVGAVHDVSLWLDPARPCLRR